LPPALLLKLAQRKTRVLTPVQMQALAQEPAQARALVYAQRHVCALGRQADGRAQLIATAQIQQQACALGLKDRLRPCCKSSRSIPAWFHPVRYLRPELSFPGQYWRQSAQRC
jgi:hypothetical protein